MHNTVIHRVEILQIRATSHREKHSKFNKFNTSANQHKSTSIVLQTNEIITERSFLDQIGRQLEA
jgi:hypothetical protein